MICWGISASLRREAHAPVSFAGVYVAWRRLAAFNSAWLLVGTQTRGSAVRLGTAGLQHTHTALNHTRLLVLDLMSWLLGEGEAMTHRDHQGQRYHHLHHVAFYRTLLKLE